MSVLSTITKATREEAALLKLASREGAATRVLGGVARKRILDYLRARMLKLGLKPGNLEVAISKAGGEFLRLSAGAVKRLYVSVAEFQSLILRRVPGAARTVLAQFSEAEWTEIINKAKAVLLAPQSKVGQYASGVKGIILELSMRLDERFGELTARLNAKLPALAKSDRELSRIQWSPKVTTHINCTTPTPAGVGEVADAVFATYGLDAKKAEHVWIAGMADSKSESNALELVEKGKRQFPRGGAVIETEGELLGQAETNIERIKEFGITVPGKGYYPPERVHVRWPQKAWASDDARQVTELLGVIPPDTPADTLKRVSAACRQKRITFWTNSLKGETAKAAANVVLKAMNPP